MNTSKDDSQTIRAGKVGIHLSEEISSENFSSLGQPEVIIAERILAGENAYIVDTDQVDESLLEGKVLYRAVTRILDFLVAAIVLVILAIPICIIAALIKLDSPGPAFYKQERLGINGKPFIIYKFRSMHLDAEKNGAQWAEEEDPRVTRFGRLLRLHRLDEFPQFINVIKGEMSLIGPRPERAVFYDLFEQHIPGFRKRLIVRPGITGFAQISGGYSLSPEEKLTYDLTYIRDRSFKLDVGIILETVRIVIHRDGAR